MIITIVTPTFNAVEFLEDCLASARRNATPEITVEHVIADGGSTDGTVELARSYGATVLTGKDKGIFDAINKGSFNSSGELLGFLGGDDMLLDGALEEVVRHYKKTDRPWLVGGIRWIDPQGRSLGELAAPPNWMTPRLHASIGWNPIMQMSTFLTRPFFESLGGYNIEYRDSADYEMYARALTHAPYARIDKPLSCFRRTGHNNSAVHPERTTRENGQVRDLFGPKSSAELMFNRYFMKAWLNAANPAWALRKFRDQIQMKTTPHKVAYF